MSTISRRLFGLVSIRAALDDEPIKVSDIAKILGISRNACDAIARDMEGLGYITVDRSIPNYRYVKASDFLLEVFHEYAMWNADFSYKSGLSQANIAMQAPKIYAK